MGIAAYLAEQADKPVLRFITCGSVDDGKSTLIGRLLYESKAIFDDQLAAVSEDSRRYGTQGESLDLALLVDGLQAEREQGITIDVAYRFFSTDRRRFIVADTPGHEQYTRNMATGASTADAAVILVDARKGLQTQTRRHTRIVTMMGIRHIVLAVNKMDQVAFDQKVFTAIETDYRAFLATLEEGGEVSMQAIPLSALHGDNVTTLSQRTPWYEGPTLLQWLETVSPWPDHRARPFRMAVQWVNRPNMDFRGFCGRIGQGVVRVGDRVRILPAGTEAEVETILSGFDSVPEAGAGDSVTLTLAQEVDVSRGDVIAAADASPEVADQFRVRLIWMSETPLIPERQYLIKLATRETTATVTEIRHRIDVNTGARLAAKTLSLNEIAVANLATAQPVVFEPYSENRSLGAFILIDKLTYETVGAGMIEFALRRAQHVHWQALEIDKAARARFKQQQPRCIWMTGLSGAGKSTIANLLEKKLYELGRHTYLLDGDNLRHGLNRDLGFTDADRVENVRRAAEVARLMVDAGLIVIVSLISPFRAERAMARALFEPGEFVEVFVDAPLDVCMQRDVKGLYARAQAGEIRNFTGLDSPYEAPEQPEVHIETHRCDPEAAVRRILDYLEQSDWTAR